VAFHVGNGSSTVNRSPELSGGSAIHTGLSNRDGCSTLCSGRSVESLELRLSAEAV
jgi:hypothetical protein